MRALPRAGERVRARHRHPLPPGGIGGRPDRHAAGGHVLGRPALRGPRPGGAPVALCRAPAGYPALAATEAVKGGHYLAHDPAAIPGHRLVAGVFRHQPDVAFDAPERLDRGPVAEPRRHDVAVDRVVLLADHHAVTVENVRADHGIACYLDREQVPGTDHVPR